MSVTLWVRLGWLWWLSAAVLGLSFQLQLGQRARLTKALEQRPELEVLYAPSPEVMELTSLGFRTLSADLLWIRCLQFFAGSQARWRAPEQAKPYLDGLFALDPDFKEAYRWAGAALLMGAQGGATNAQVELANHYLIRAMQRFPSEYQWPYSVGLNYAFWTPPGPQKVEFMRLGATYLERAAQLEGVPSHVTTLIASVLFDERDPSAMVRFIKQAYLLEGDPERRKMLASRLASVGVEDVLLDVQRSERVRGRWQARSYPYLDQGLFLWVGSRHPWDLTRGLVGHDGVPDGGF